MNNIRSTLASVWRIAAPYFRSEDKWAGRGLLAAVIAIELAVVFLTVLFNRWNNVFYNALQEHNQAVFTYQIGYFCVLAAFWIGLKVYQLYLNQWLQIRWRRWMTARYLGGWMHDANHYRMQLLGDAADKLVDVGRFEPHYTVIGVGEDFEARKLVGLGRIERDEVVDLLGDDQGVGRRRGLRHGRQRDDRTRHQGVHQGFQHVVAPSELTAACLTGCPRGKSFHLNPFAGRWQATPRSQAGARVKPRLAAMRLGV